MFKCICFIIISAKKFTEKIPTSKKSEKNDVEVFAILLVNLALHYAIKNENVFTRLLRDTTDALSDEMSMIQFIFCDYLENEISKNSH